MYDGSSFDIVNSADDKSSFDIVNSCVLVFSVVNVEFLVDLCVTGDGGGGGGGAMNIVNINMSLIRTTF